MESKIRKGDFVGRYNIKIQLKTGKDRLFNRVLIDNDQFKQFGHFRLTDERGEITLIVKSDWKAYQFDSKNCH